MKIACFTGNQARHQFLIERMAEIADEVFAVMECATVFPGLQPQFFKKSEVMQNYFNKVIAEEKNLFGKPGFISEGVKVFPIASGDLSRVPLESLQPVKEADLVVVFGSSYIKGELCDLLVEKGAINIHMGVSPYYRGSSCNFWALDDERPEYVGGTVHLLTEGLDSGPILFHALPEPREYRSFEIGMVAVEATIKSLARKIKSGEICDIKPVVQNKSLELRYSKYTDFTEEKAQSFLDNPMDSTLILQRLQGRNLSEFIL